ncbi:hypothetical protein [Streptomyces sp. EN16]|uniref:hypothetical protein n=1 Tax=Streptomyces sp. EN16 TaxID=212773 RepID=UPI001C40741A|nr:hypothetical protein [Streptomyces sp. EN16]
MLDDHGLPRAAHHDGGRLRGRRLPLVPGLRIANKDKVDRHAGPRPYESRSSTTSWSSRSVVLRRSREAGQSSLDW